MKKISIFAMVFVLMISIVVAVGAPEDAGGSPEIKEAGQAADKETPKPMLISLISENTKTQQKNQGEEVQIQNTAAVQVKAKAGEYVSESGKTIQIREQANNRLQIHSGGVSAATSMEMTQEQVQDKTKLMVKLSNGKNSEVKVMPDTASQRALERLRLKVCSEENNCQIELKEVGQGEQVRVAYEVQAQKQARFLGLFKTKMQVQAQVDAETGEVIQAKKPWWAFLASEPEE
ncbi:MAG: hypothetical protein V1831_03835 [Candidatus Woesearchaeota archaeon]